MQDYNFPVELQPIYLANGQEIPQRKSVVRTDTMQSLGIVSDDYGLVKHADVVDAFREAGSDYEIKEQLQLTHNGGRLFFKMEFPQTQYEVRKGDFVRMMLIVKNSYNGLNSLRVVLGALRLVCTNGMVLGREFFAFNFRHIGNVRGMGSDTFNDAVIDQYRKTYEHYIDLFSKRMPVVNKMVGTKLPITQDEAFRTDENITQLPKYLIDEAFENYVASEDKGNVWGYYNALTYAITHKMKKENPELALEYGAKAWDTSLKFLN